MWFMNGSEHYLYNLPNQYFKGGKKIKLNKIDLTIWKLKKKFLKIKKFISLLLNLDCKSGQKKQNF